LHVGPMLVEEHAERADSRVCISCVQDTVRKCDTSSDNTFSVRSMVRRAIGRSYTLKLCDLLALIQHSRVAGRSERPLAGNGRPFIAATGTLRCRFFYVIRKSHGTNAGLNNAVAGLSTCNGMIPDIVLLRIHPLWDASYSRITPFFL
jgi:hypothetical protein